MVLKIGIGRTQDKDNDLFQDFHKMAVRNRGDQELMRELISPASVKEDAEFLMAPYLNFESFLAPAPMSISVLGELHM